MVLTLVMVIDAACGKRDLPTGGNQEPQKLPTADKLGSSANPEPPKVESEASPAMSSLSSSVPTALPRATVELPPKGFKLADVLGKAKRDVDRALGHGKQLDDGPWDYGFGKVAVAVVFEAGHAVFVSVAAPEFHNTEADRTVVLAWMQATDGVEFDHTHNFDFELGVWAPGAQDRQLARDAVAEQVTEGLKSSVGGFASANYTWMEVSLQDLDTCSRAVLGQIARAYDLKNAGFEVMECVNEADIKLPLR